MPALPHLLLKRGECAACTELSRREPQNRRLVIPFSLFHSTGGVFLAAAPSGPVSPLGSTTGDWGGGGPWCDVGVDQPTPLGPVGVVPGNLVKEGLGAVVSSLLI